jgi:hypothetical protein
MSTSSGCWLPIDEAARQRADGLFHQQCWLWGCDIRRPEGNALLTYGFWRQRPPEGAPGSSAYLLQRDPSTVVVLWKFGIFYGSPVEGGVFLGRYGFEPTGVPRLDTTVPPWSPEQLVVGEPPHTDAEPVRAQLQFVGLLRWIAEYEAWIVEEFGLPYRQQCVAAWTFGPFRIAAERLVDEWNQLAACCGKAQVCR